MKFFDKIKRGVAWLAGYEPSKAYAFAAPGQRSRPDFPTQYHERVNHPQISIRPETNKESRLGKITKEKSVFRGPEVDFVLHTRDEEFEDLLYNQLALTNDTDKLAHCLERLRKRIATNQIDLSPKDAEYLRDKLYKKAEVIHEGYPEGKFRYMEKDFRQTADLIALRYLDRTKKYDDQYL